MSLVRLALRNPHAVVVLGLLVLIIGITCTVRTPVDILPQFKTPAVQILTLYPGMPTDVVERDITNRLERWTSQANGIARQESHSVIGVSVVKDFFRPDIDPNAALSQVSSLAISDLYYLPPGTVPPMVMPFDPTASQPLCLLALSSATLDETALYDVAYFQIRNLLSGTPGVIAPAVYGGRLRRILVYLDRDRMQARGLSPMDVVHAIGRFNVLIPTGDANIGDFDYQVVSNAMVENVAQFNDIPIRMGRDGKAIYVRDVGTAQDTYAIQTNAVDIQGKRAVYIPIYRQPGANTIQVVDGIKAAIPGIGQRVTSGRQIAMQVIVDQSVYVRRAIAGLEGEALLGAGLAAAMILIFLGSFRSTLIIAVSLPLSVLSAIMALYFTGQTINAMTLGGLALSVGILMDNGIVVLENIARHLEMGKPPGDAVRDAAGEVAMPVLVATITICVVFTPVMFLSGIGRFLFGPLALAVIYAIGASYGLSMTVVPAAGARFLRPEHLGLHAAVDQAYDRLQAAYERTLRHAIRFRLVTLAGLLGLFLLSLFLLPLLGQELFPQIDAGQFMILMRAPSGMRMAKTEKYARAVEAEVRRVIPPDEVQQVVSNVGILYDWPAAYTPNAGPQDAFVLVQLQPRHRLSAQAYADRLRHTLPAKLPGVAFAFDTGGLVSSALNFGLPSPIDVQVEGPALDVARRIAETVRTQVRQVPGAVDVRIQQSLDYPQIRLDFSLDRAAAMGLTSENLVKNVVTALNGSTTFQPSFWIDGKSGNHYFVGASYREQDIRTRQTIADIPVTGDGQDTPVPLRNVTRMGAAKSAVEVNHVNIRRVTDLFANVHGRDAGSVARDVQGILDRLQLPSGYTVAIRGEIAAMKESFAQLGFGLLLASALVYLVMVVQFRSFVDPLIIMFVVPMGIIGVLGMLWLTHTTLNVQSLMGVVMMIGLSVSYSILIVDFANQLARDGMPLVEAVVRASTIRLRPILMTSLAAILGFVPMGLHAGEANMPLARAVIGGLAVSAVLKLYLLPVVYTYLKRPPVEPS